MTTPEGFGENPTPPEDAVFFKHLEHEFTGTAEYAEILGTAEQQDAIFSDASALKEALSQLIPQLREAQFADIKRPSYANGGELAEDGQPLILSHDDINLLTHERPDFAEQIARKIHRDQLAQRQQLAIDKERAATENNAVSLDELENRRQKLDSQAATIEVCTAIALMHPFMMEAYDDPIDKKYFSNIHWGAAFDLDSRVHTLSGVLRELHQLEEQNQKWSLAHITAYKTQYGHMPREEQFAERLHDDREKRLIQIEKYRRFLDDVAYGRLTTDQPDVDTAIPTPKELVTLTSEQTRIANLPGIDPVSMVLQERLAELPKDGWLINADQIAIGIQGGLQIYRYTDGALRVEHVSGSKYGSPYIDVAFASENAGGTSIGYQPSDAELTYAGYTYTPAYHETIADGDNELRYDFLPLRASHGAHGTRATSTDVNRSAGQDNGWSGKYFNVARVTDSADEARTIVAELFSVMSASESSVGKLITVLDEKDVFTDRLKVMMSGERAQRQAVIQARMPQPEDDDLYGEDYEPYEG